MTTVSVETGARLHFGFQNLSLAHERLYGGVGVGLAEPGLTVQAEPAAAVECSETLRPYVEQAVDALGVEGAAVELTEGYDRHVGLGSGTQIALGALVAIARAHGERVDPRALAPQLGRGGRSGVGVAVFESGGFVVDVGHPTERFTTAPPGPGSWTVPEPLGRWTLPDSWRFLLVTPDESPGRSGEEEDESIRTIVERADGSIADDIATLLTRRLLPAVVEGDLPAFGAAVSRLGRLNGAWFADEQGGVYRPPAGQLIDRLGSSQAVFGTGQSSWGPTVYGVTDADHAERAAAAGERALAEGGLDGEVRIVAPSTSGAQIQE
ncbi:GHMP kinase [Halovenus sp. WSH3]|uniref:Beta-ribofuranosylaminobenzene 5'-phosphate synthase n=1 Tax=Halovenus carboxidivorans TaxID=2692199 RepID=A0A6B0SZG9_9EURY|nr:beta-ribofuranosylaminobenzene 5'-phosphate synthase family protein [Halovenus carboxidivorans]MXR50905.1 GHMP kinase [Halovenus carboxidivorans]